MNTTSTYGLTHLAIAVRDVEKTLEFYQSVFDMHLMYHVQYLFTKGVKLE